MLLVLSACAPTSKQLVTYRHYVIWLCGRLSSPTRHSGGSLYARLQVEAAMHDIRIPWPAMEGTQEVLLAHRHIGVNVHMLRCWLTKLRW
jgi:hypothetical protein